MEVKIDLRRYFLAIKKNKLIVIIVAIASLAIGILLNYNVKPDKYRAYSNVYSVSFGSYTDSVEGVYVLQTYSDIINSRKVANRAAMIIGDDSLDGEKIKSMITYSYSEQSPVYYIYATTTDPQLSMTIANAVAKAFVIEMNNIMGEDNAQILDEAYDYEQVFNGRKDQIKNILIITLLGTLLCLFVIIMISFFSNKVESVNDVTLNGEIEILGVIPNFDVE